MIPAKTIAIITKIVTLFFVSILFYDFCIYKYSGFEDVIYVGNKLRSVVDVFVLVGRELFCLFVFEFDFVG